ncbi:MAG TPA: Hpt domain-containing protein [Rhodanobacteraceae bacterium]|nr:Hpt domain-containing protein [Rhodanobacteraceae bacterium]
MVAESDPREAEFQAQIEALRRHFLQELPERRAALAAAWHDCTAAGDETPWLRLRDVAHKLSGSAPCYGLDAVGEAARDLDRLLSGRDPCRERDAADGAVAELLAALDAAIHPA